MQREQVENKKPCGRNIHVGGQIMPASSLRIINGFVKNPKEGTYSVARQFYKTGTMTVETLVSIKKDEGIISNVPVLMMNPTDEDIAIKENMIVGYMEDYETSVKVNVATIAERLKENQNKLVSEDKHVVRGEILCIINESNDRTKSESVVVNSKEMTKENSSKQSPDTLNNEGKHLLCKEDISCGDSEYHEKDTSLFNHFRDVITLSNEPIGTINIQIHKIYGFT